MTFCSFHAVASSVIYYSTHARENEIYLFYTSKLLWKEYVLLLYDIIRDLYFNSARTRTNEIASFMHVYELLLIIVKLLQDLWLQYVQSYTQRLILLLWVWNCRNVRPKEISTYDLPEVLAICILQTSSLFFADSQSLLSLLFFSNKASQLLHSPSYKRQKIHSWNSPFV